MSWSVEQTEVQHDLWSWWSCLRTWSEKKSENKYFQNNDFRVISSEQLQIQFQRADLVRQNSQSKVSTKIESSQSLRSINLIKSITVAAVKKPAQKLSWSCRHCREDYWNADCQQKMNFTNADQMNLKTALKNNLNSSESTISEQLKNQ